MSSDKSDANSSTSSPKRDERVAAKATRAPPQSNRRTCLLAPTGIGAAAVLTVSDPVPSASAQSAAPQSTASSNPLSAKKGFKGVIKLDARDSTPDWGPFTPARAPEGSPN